jgi:hypothetical protein
VAARLEHQPGADPVELAQEMRALLHHGRAVEQRATGETRRTGLPQVWPSMQEKVWLAIDQNLPEALSPLEVMSAF